MTPAEFAIQGVYFSPALVSAMLGLIAASVTASLLNRFRISRFFYYPPLVYLSIAVIYTVLIGTFLIPF
jgi:hypothetical protein